MTGGPALPSVTRAGAGRPGGHAGTYGVPQDAAGSSPVMGDPSRPRRLATVLAMVALLAAAWLVHWRTFHLRELGVDGYLSVDLGTSPVREMLAFTARDVHPPLFFAVLHSWFGLVGASYDTAKVVPIAWSLVALAALFSLGRLLLGRLAALVAVAVLASSVSYLFESPTVRPFTLGLALSLASLALVVSMVRRRGARGPLGSAAPAVLGAVTAMGLLAWYFHLAFVATELAVLASVAVRSRPGGRRRVAPAATALAAGCLASLPWFLYAASSLRAHVVQGGFAHDSLATFASLLGIVDAISRALTGAGVSVLTVAASVGWACSTCGGIAAVVVSARKRAERDGCGVAPSPPPLAAVVTVGGLILTLAGVVAVLSRWQHPDALGRYVLAIVPFAALLQAAAVTRGPIPARLASAACLVAVIYCSARWLRALTAGEGIDWTHDEDLVYVAAHAQPGDALLFSDRARRSQYVLAGGALPTAVVQTSGARYLHATAEDAARTIAGLAPRARRIWYLETGELPGTVPVGRLELRRQVFLTWHQTFGVKDTQLFLTRPADRRAPAGVTLGEAVTLESAAFTSHARPGGAVDAALVWHDLRPLGGKYSVFVHVDDAGGKLIAQHDGPPAGDARPTDSWIPGELIEDLHGVTLPATIAPGDYRVNVGMYQGNRRLAAPDGATSVELGVVHVRAE